MLDDAEEGSRDTGSYSFENEGKDGTIEGSIKSSRNWKRVGILKVSGVKEYRE